MIVKTPWPHTPTHGDHYLFYFNESMLLLTMLNLMMNHQEDMIYGCYCEYGGKESCHKLSAINIEPLQDITIVGILEI